MEKNYIHPEELLEFDFVQEQTMAAHEHENPELLFVLEGMLHVKASGKTYDLGGEDFILINANRTHSYQASGKLLAVRFRISLPKLREMLQQNTAVFWCCSVLEKTAAYEEVRRTLKEIILGSVNRGQHDGFYIRSLHYRLLSQLCANFLLDEKRSGKINTGAGGENGAALPEIGSRDSERMEQILDYIRMNYRGSISLQDVADELFLSPTYLSKFIHKSSGKGFVDLISSVRLSHALEDLMYTDHSVTKIAMDNGFPSVAALNKVFKEAHAVTPSEYRKEKKKEALQEKDQELRQKTAVYLQQHFGEQEKDSAKEEKVLLQLSAHSARNGSKMEMQQILNVGRARDLLNAGTQRQVLYSRDHLGTRYIRFWNLFDPELYLDQEPRQKQLHFGRLDEVLDFLTENGFCPYIELRSKDLRLFGTVDNALRVNDAEEDFADQRERRMFFEELFAHLTRRYGRGEVNQWIFSYMLSVNVKFSEGELTFNDLTDEAWQAWLEEYELIASLLHARFPQARMGGAGFPVHHYGEKRLAELFAIWRGRRVQPDFISVTSFPYQIVREGGRWYERRRTNLDFAANDVTAARAGMMEGGYGNLPLHLTECNLTLSDRSFLNDSLTRAAFAAAAVSRIYDEVDFFGMWNARDAYVDYADSASYLFGGSGMLTKTGAPKPVFHALSFLGRLYPEVVTWQKGCLVTANEHGHFKILASHPVNMNTAYYLRDESKISALEIDQMLETDLHMTWHIRITDVPEGNWQIRRYCLNHRSGSILSEWINLDMEAELRQEELRYLDRICMPRLFIQRQYAEKGILEFDITLEPNEVQYLHVTEFE